MSDPPPKKIGSLRDRIAAFENKGGAPVPAPAPAPRPKPGGLSQWKPRATSPPVASEDEGEKQERKIAGGMSAADAKASIGAGGSLKERMAALQGRSAFGMPAAPSTPPKPAGEKPKWKPPPQPVASPPPTEAGEESTAAPEPRVTSPPPQGEPQAAKEQDTEEKPEEKQETGEPDPEEEERQRRAALAARMARLGGARVGMGPPIFGKKPDIKKPEVAKEDERKETPETETVTSPPAEEPRSPPVAAAETLASEKTTESSTGYFEDKNASSTSLLSADSASTNTPKSPAMPAPAMPRRAAPPRRKAPKSPSPAPPTPSIDVAVVAESPAPDAPPSPDESEESKQLQEAVHKSKEDEASLGLPPAVLEHREIAPPHVDPPESSADAETAPEPSSKNEEEVHELPSKHEDAHEHAEPPAAESEREVAPEPTEVVEPKATEPAQEDGASVPEVPSTEPEEKPKEEPIHEAPMTEEPVAIVPEPAAVDEEEDEQERRKRIAERLRQQGGFNPFGAPPPPPVRRPSEASSEQEVEVPTRKPSLDSPRSPPLSPPVPPRPASLRKDSAGSAIASPPPPERRTSLRQGSMDSITGSLRSPPLPPVSSRPDVPTRKSSVASTKSKEVEDVAEEQIQDDEQEIRVRESVNASSGVIQEEPEVSDDGYEDARSGNPETVHAAEDGPGRSAGPEASAWYDEPEEDDRAHESHVHAAEQPPSQAGGFEEPTTESISPISPPPTEQHPPPPPNRTSLPPPPKRTSLPPPPRGIPPPAPPPVLKQEPEYDEPEEGHLEVDDEPESVYSPSPISPPARQAPPPPPAVVQPEEHSPEPEQPPPPPPPRRQSSDVHPARRSIPPPPPPHEPELEHESALAEEEQPALQPPLGSHPARRSIPPPPPPVITDNHEDDAHDDASDYGPASPRSEAYSEDGQALQIPSALNSQVPSPVSPSRVPPAIVIPDQKESEVFDEADVDPIDPSFYSPSKPTFSPSAPEPPALNLAPPPQKTTRPTEEPAEDEQVAEPEQEPEAESEPQAEVEKAPAPEAEKAPEPEDKAEEDEEQTRRRTIAERMAKLGGIRFGAPPPPVARRPPPPPTEEAASSEAEEHEQPQKADEPETAQEEPEEDEFARKQRIAAKIAGMGGMRFGMIPTPMAPPQPPVRSPSQPSAHEVEAEEEEAPPPPPPRTARRQESHDAHDEEAPPPPPPRRPSHHEEPREVDLDTQSADDGEHVEAEESEAEVVVHPEEEEAPPPVPSRPFRRESAPSPETPRPPVPGGRPPVPAGRPPVPPTAPPPPVSVAPPTPRDDFVMVEAPEEAPPVPPPRSASLRRPPPRSAPPPPPPPPPMAEEPGTPTSQWGSSVDFGGDADLSLSAQWSEDSTQYPPAPPARTQSISQHSQQSVVPQHLSSDELMAQWGRIGVQIHEVATTLFEKSKKSLVGDGTYVGFINAVLHEVPTAAKPLPPYDTFGYVIYEQNGPSVLRRASDIMPGDIVVLHDAKLKGHKGIQIYHQNVGVGQPLVAIIGDYEVKKSKVRVFQANQHVGQESVESVSYRLEDLKTGLVKIFRVLEA